jgi:hypothetical protein
MRNGEKRLRRLYGLFQQCEDDRRGSGWFADEDKVSLGFRCVLFAPNPWGTCWLHYPATNVVCEM